MADIRINRDHVLLAMIILTGILIRLLRFVSVRHGELNPDARLYVTLAKQIQQGSYSSTFREPLFPLTLAASFMVFGSSNDIARLTTVSLSILMIPLTYKIGKETFCSSCGLLASFLIATNYQLIFSSTEGMREELFGVMLLIFLYFSNTIGENEENYKKAALLAFLLCLTKYEGIIILLPIVFWLGWRAKSQGQRIPRKKIGTILFSLILFCLVIFAFGIIMHGDPFISFKTHGGYFYVWEFKREEFGVVPFVYSDLGISLFEYLFSYHTPLELLQGVIWGLFILFEIDFFGITFFWSIMMLVGILLALVEDRGFYLPISLILVVPFLAFFNYLGLGTRIYNPLFPIFSILIAFAAFRLYQTGVPYFNNLNKLHRLFAIVIFFSIFTRYMMVNLICVRTFSFCGYYPLHNIRFAPGIYPFIIIGFVPIVILFLFYYQKRSKKIPPSN